MRPTHPSKFLKPDSEEASEGVDPLNSDTVVAPMTTDTESKKLNIEAQKLEPTRFGDWERNGRCIDF